MKGKKKNFLNAKFLNKRPVGKPRTRWKDVARRDTSQILGIRRWSGQAEGREKWKVF